MSDKVIKLDIIDQKILTVLNKNSRISITELSKFIKHHYPTVRNRINKLEENNVIRHYYPMLQFVGIGIRRTLGIYISVKTGTLEYENLIKKFISNPYIIQVYELDGRWNIFLLLTTNFVKEARDNMDIIKQLCGKNTQEITAMTPFTISYLTKNFFLSFDFEVPKGKLKTGYTPLAEKANNPFVHLTGPLKLDNIDFKILNYLKLDANASQEEIGKATGISQPLVNYRLRKYLKNHLITHFGIEVNPEVLGYSLCLLVLNLGGNTKAKEEIVKQLKNDKRAYHYFEYLEYWEMVITFCVKSREEMEEIKKDIIDKYSEHIKDYDVVWVKKRKKIEPYPDIGLVYPKRLSNKSML